VFGVRSVHSRRIPRMVFCVKFGIVAN
jgi:hypothetical protein